MPTLQLLRNDPKESNLFLAGANSSTAAVATYVVMAYANRTRFVGMKPIDDDQELAEIERMLDAARGTALADAEANGMQLIGRLHL